MLQLGDKSIQQRLCLITLPGGGGVHHEDHFLHPVVGAPDRNIIHMKKKNL